MKNIIYSISIWLILVSILYISEIMWLFQLIFFILVYSAIFYWIYYIFNKIRKKEIKKYKHFLLNFIKKWSLSFVIIWILIWSFWYYQNEISPATMTEYTISNWKKTVVFQEMSHIWAKNYYEKVKQNLINYKKDWFVYFFEWVKPWKKENMNKFDKAIWINFKPDLYKNFSKLYWVTFQTTKMYLWLVNDLDFNIDVDIDWIIEKYENILTKPISWIISNSQSKKAPKKETVDINAKIIETLAELSEKQLKILVFINKAILNALIKSDSTQNLIQENFANKQLFDVILWWRNNILSSEIIKSKYNKIYITYWKLHFKWVFDILKEQDKNWKIINKKEINSMN
jgi:energy-coupling factor transporter transmembrane protein EcfT